MGWLRERLRRHSASPGEGELSQSSAIAPLQQTPSDSINSPGVGWRPLIAGETLHDVEGVGGAFHSRLANRLRWESLDGLSVYSAAPGTPIPDRLVPLTNVEPDFWKMIATQPGAMVFEGSKRSLLVQGLLGDAPIWYGYQFPLGTQPEMTHDEILGEWKWRFDIGGSPRTIAESYVTFLRDDIAIPTEYAHVDLSEAPVTLEGFLETMSQFDPTVLSGPDQLTAEWEGAPRGWMVDLSANREDRPVLMALNGEVTMYGDLVDIKGAFGEFTIETNRIIGGTRMPIESQILPTPTLSMTGFPARG